MPRFERRELVERFRYMIARGEPIIGGGAGTGLSAKSEEAGGIDLIVIYNSGRYRMAGRGSLAGLLAYGNANDIVVEMAAEVLPVVRKTPVLAGVNGTDPFMLLEPFLRRLIDLGFSGVQNFPTVGLIDGIFRVNLEETGMGFGLEIDMIRAAHELDMLTTPYVFGEEGARGNDGGRRRYHRLPSRPDHRRRDRSGNGSHARRLRQTYRCLVGSGPPRARGRHRVVPRRAHLDAGGRRLHFVDLFRLRWVLRRVEHGAIADGAGARRADAQVQGSRTGLTQASGQMHMQDFGQDGGGK